MNAISKFMLALLVALADVSCSTSQRQSETAPILPFRGAGTTELGVVSVKRGVDRGSVEWHLVADKVGEEYVTGALEREFGMKRIRTDQEFEMILRTKFVGVGGKDLARALWNRYRSATFSSLECNNATIVFFDSDHRSIEAWPRLEHVTRTERQ